MNKYILIIFSFIFISCATDNDTVKNDISLAKESFKPPIESKVWEILSKTESNDANEVYDFYVSEKASYDGQLHNDNTMAMWHKAFLDYSKDLNIDQVNTILNDMDSMEFNSVSYRTYYRLLYHNKQHLTTYQNRENSFYNKNIDYLNSAEWKNKEINKKIINNLNKEHFVFK